MSFTAKDVQALREKTSCGMMDCKKALTEAEGNMEKAVELLREKGLAAAAKKAGRIAAEGLVYAAVNNVSGVGAIVEINSETDFVANNEDFQNFVKAVTETVISENPADVAALLACKMAGTGVTVEEVLREKILTIGENLVLRRFVRGEGPVMTYVHGGGRIGVMVSLDTTAEASKSPAFEEFAKDVCMQIAAVSPQFTSRDEVPSEHLEKEKEILFAQAINEGKPANIAEKMVAGRIQKYYKEVCLLEQPFVKDADITVKQYADNTAKKLGTALSVKSFVRFEKGEGIEKKENDFASEVAKMAK